MSIENEHCKFFEQFILNEWDKLRDSQAGLEIARWRVLYWKEKYKKEINDCTRCLGRLNAITEGLSNAGIKLDIEPEIYFK